MKTEEKIKRDKTPPVSSEARDRKFLEQLWALSLDDSKSAEQKIKEVEDSRKKGIIRRVCSGRF